MVLPSVFEPARLSAPPLATRTSLKIGGRPELFFEPETRDEAAEIIRALREQGVPIHFLGGGYNVLVRDGVLPGAVITSRRLTYTRRERDCVVVGAGISFPRLVRNAAAWHIPTISGCPGIPGQVGGVIAMNAGGRFGCVSDALLAVEGVDDEGNPFDVAVDGSAFGYRTSPFLGCFITGATFRRLPSFDESEARARFQEAMAWKRVTQPLNVASAGCMFKNPAPSLSAGRLIEAAGLKGERVGGAQVSDLHANFIVNRGNATAEDVWRLVRRIQERVEETSSIALELEVRTW